MITRQQHVITFFFQKLHMIHSDLKAFHFRDHFQKAGLAALVAGGLMWKQEWNNK